MNRREFLLSALPDRNKLDEAVALIQRATGTDRIHPYPTGLAVVLDVRQGYYTLSRGFGSASGASTLFLLGSISKPICATGVMILVDRRELSLADSVGKFIPEFSFGIRRYVTIKDLLTHTSGLPELLPETAELLKRHASLSDFVVATCRTPLIFKPGSKVHYTNLGILVASEIVERITSVRFPEFLRRQVFEPLSMSNTSLGLGGRQVTDTAQCQTPAGLRYGPIINSPYYRGLGAPWGGVHSTAPDMARFLKVFMNLDNTLLRHETKIAMITNQTQGLNNSWGLGWMLCQSYDESLAEIGKLSWCGFSWAWLLGLCRTRLTAFGNACSARTFGHWGVTGTMAWVDPEIDAIFVLLTNRRARYARDGLLGPVSDLVSQSLNKPDPSAARQDQAGGAS
jgi:beta-lactamase class C